MTFRSGVMEDSGRWCGIADSRHQLVADAEVLLHIRFIDSEIWVIVDGRIPLQIFTDRAH